jgi:glycosyltransferase involved in cell wall biosynthesis
MKVIQIPFSFPPNPPGGTEVYVSQLAKDLNALGETALVAAPAEETRAYTIDGLNVRRFGLTQNIEDTIELYGLGDPRAAAEFAEILDDESPDLIHLHAFTSAISVRLIRTARMRKIPVVLTYHTPTVSCQRGTLLLWGDQICDGRLDIVRCSGCTLHGLGLNAPLSRIIGHIPPRAGKWLGDRGLKGGIWTALRTSELISERHAAFRIMTAEVDRIVAVCGWVQQLLLNNDVSPRKVVLSRHGINWTSASRIPIFETETERAVEETRIAFMGRLEPVKGLDVLIRAIKMSPGLKLKLEVFGIVQNEGQRKYQKELETLIGNDERISFCEPIPSSQVVSRLKEYDFLAVPSQWMETGPLVVLEAFAAGIPVIGWNIGGLGELVTHDVDGLLIEPGPGGVDRWVETLQRVADDANLRSRLKVGVQPPRRSIDVALEMLGLYNAVLAEAVESQSK